MKEVADIYGRLINQHSSKNQTVFSARFDKQDEDDQVLEELELYFTLNIFRNLTESDFDNIDIESQLDHKFQN